jgi:hypothetical protein
MPDSYSNPSYKPPTRPYKWVPNTIPNGGDTPIGFYPPQIVRGAFRNDITIQEGFTGSTVTVTATGTMISSKGSENNPILAVHRPMVDPDNDRGVPPSELFDISGNFKWQVELSQATRISSITIEYALVVDVNDPALLALLDPGDAAALALYLQHPTGEPPSIDWSKYKFAKITLDDKEYPANGTDGKPKELAVTGVTKTVKLHTVKFVDSFVVSGFPITKRIAISNRSGLDTLELILSKVYIFDAARVNLHDNQLPSALMEYAYPTRFSFTPSPSMNAQRLPFPSDADNPNFHFKIYSPEELIATKYGMAHSINLRFLVFSMPILGIDPTGVNNLYFAIFIGPAPGRRTVKTALSGELAQSHIANANKNRVVVADSFTIEKDTKTLRLEKVASAAAISPPANNANWIRIDNSTYNVVGNNTFGDEGSYVSEYLFLDNSTSVNNWYRTVQSLGSGAEKISAPFQNKTYSEHIVYKALSSATTSTKKDSVVRRIPIMSDFIGGSPLNAERPISTFVMDGFNALVNPIRIRKGSFKLAIRAKVEDPSFLLNTHLYARFWFVPDGSDTDVNNLYHWRDSTEFHFETSATGTKVVQGAPRSMQDLIVSPPIPNSLTYLEMVRYNDVEVDFPEKGHSAPFSGAKLMVALYAVGYPSADGTAQNITKNTPNLPKITIELDSQYGTFETPIQYVESNVLFAQRASRYNSSQFIAVDAPQIVTKGKIGGGELDSGAYPKYDSKFKSNDSEPFNGLLKMNKSDSGTLAKFCIPITAVPGEKDEQTSVYADFATADKSLDSGRVLDGDWKVSFTVNRGIDTTLVAIDYRIEMFLVSGDGKVTERIFRSSTVNGVKISGTGDISYTASIKIPMIISGSGTQLVMRLIGYPYSRSGNAVDVGSIQNQLGSTPFGIRIDSLQIVSHTLSRLSISQVASFLGSPAFNENLQVVPNQSIGETSDFWFIASDFLTHVFVVDASVGIDITGSLYSPAWFINMPKDMEIRARGQGFLDQDVWSRTVVADGTSAGEGATSAVEDKHSKTVHVAHEDVDTVGGQSISMMSDSPVIKHKVFDSPYRKSLLDDNVAGRNAGGISVLGNTAPNLQFINMGSFTNDNPAVLGLISQHEGNDYASAQASMNTSLGGFGTWFGSNRDMAANDFATVKKFADGFLSPVMAQSSVSSLVYVAGWCEPGAILLKEASMWDSNTNTASGNIFLVDGLTNNPIPDSSPITQPSFISGLKAVQTFPGIIIDAHNTVTVAYTLEGRTGELYARSLIGGQGMSNPYVIATFRSPGHLTSDVNIFAPTMSWHESTQSYYVAMWCGGKIFLTTFCGLRTSHGVLMNPLQLVAGDKDFTSGKNSANPVFQALVQSGGLINNQLGTAESDIPQQRVGLYVSDKWPFQGNAFVYYKDSNNKLMMRQVRIGGITGAQKEIS